MTVPESRWSRDDRSPRECQGKTHFHVFAELSRPPWDRFAAIKTRESREWPFTRQQDPPLEDCNELPWNRYQDRVPFEPLPGKFLNGKVKSPEFSLGDFNRTNYREISSRGKAGLLSSLEYSGPITSFEFNRIETSKLLDMH